MKKPWYKKVYALYKGENYICDGTIREIARETGKSTDFLRWMTYPVYAKRSEGGKNRFR
ncbi:hypothetical protein NSQ62_08085 [Solibacillus sp. FSL H8-0523]|uniref:hypothetical protein n=1 Tax=Solibacillus sp. FSL H8-0523 TaxID=2954511 RepID=UPI00310159CF